MRKVALILVAALGACGGESIRSAHYTDGAFADDFSDPGDKEVYAAVRELPFRHIEWEYRFSTRQIARLTMGGDLLFVETPDNTVVAMDRFIGRVRWIFKIDTDTPLDWPPVVATGVPEEKRQLEAELALMARKIEDKMKETGPGKEVGDLQKKRNEVRERLRVAAYGDNVYFISRQILYCLDRLSGKLIWTHRLMFIPSAQPYAIRNYVFVPGADLARVWALDVENKGGEKTFYRAEIFSPQNQVMNRAIYSAPSVYFVCHDGKVYCYNVDTGNMSWTYVTERELRADPVVYFYRLEEEVQKAAPGPAAPGAGGMAAPGAGAMGAPAAGGMAAPAAGGMAAPAAGADDKKKPQKAVATIRFLFVGGTDNAFYALDGDSGAIVWKYECAGPIKSPAIAKDSTVYVRTEEGALHAFEVMPMHRDPKTNAALGPKRNGNLRWKIPDGERFLLKGRERVYIMGPKKEIWAIQEMTGEIVGRYRTDLLHHVLSNTADPFVYVANSAGYLYCLKESRTN
jgi:outer membrane protein assembly factor BamB